MPLPNDEIIDRVQKQVNRYIHFIWFAEGILLSTSYGRQCIWRSFIEIFMEMDGAFGDSLHPDGP